MRINTSADILTFFISLVTGIAVSLIYSFFKSYRKVFKSSVISIVFQDVFYSLICATVTFLLLFTRVYGEIRWFVLVPEFIGFVFSKIFFENYIVKLFLPFFRTIKKIIYLIKILLEKINFFLNNILDKIIIKFQKKS